MYPESSSYVELLYVIIESFLYLACVPEGYLHRFKV